MKSGRDLWEEKGAPPTPPASKVGRFTVIPVKGQDQGDPIPKNIRDLPRENEQIQFQDLLFPLDKQEDLEALGVGVGVASFDNGQIQVGDDDDDKWSYTMWRGDEWEETDLAQYAQENGQLMEEDNYCSDDAEDDGPSYVERWTEGGSGHISEDRSSLRATESIAGSFCLGILEECWPRRRNCSDWDLADADAASSYSLRRLFRSTTDLSCNIETEGHGSRIRRETDDESDDDGDNTNQSMSFALGDGPANALALSKDNSRVVVAGRNVFKILAVEEESFVELINLRVGKNLNLNYSCNDVVWSTLDESVIATGATNGAVVLWNLSKNSRAKQECVFADHQRTVHKVLFHPADPFLLLSGSQDGTVKIFDLRIKDAKLTFKSNSESVRDIQFLPKSSHCFTSVSENGSVQLWDIRKGSERPYLTFTAHSGPVFSCDWHPENHSVLATGGRDRAIKVWTISSVATLDHTIQTVASVGRVKWRPLRKNHIGSTSLVVDTSVCVWDVRRPFVPFAAFEKHKDVATGIVWKSSPHVLLSTSKDCMLWQHVFRDATRPASKAIPQALAINIRGGEIAQAVTDRSGLNDSSTLPRFQIFKKPVTLEEEFHMAQSLLFTYEVSRLWREGCRMDIAQKYILHGKNVKEVCEKNGQIAMNAKLPQVALVWEMARLFVQSLNSSDMKAELKKTGDAISSTPPKEDHDDHNMSDEDINNNSSSEAEKQDILAEIASGLHVTQNLFMPAAPTYDFQVQEEWPILPAEAFQHRHELREGSSPPIHLEDCSSRDTDEAVETVAIENRTSQLRIAPFQAVPPFDFSAPLVKALEYHAREGDVQTAVCVWIVVSKVYKLPIKQQTLEGWCYTYMEILQRNRLWTYAAAVVKYAGVLGHLSQESTSYLVSCGKCAKPLTQKTNYCDKCRKTATKCSLCHVSVMGLMSWCQGCGHGGHVSHMSKWFSKHEECPAGCGHNCLAYE